MAFSNVLFCQQPKDIPFTVKKGGNIQVRSWIEEFRLVFIRNKAPRLSDY